MFKGVSGSLKILGPGFKFERCVNYTTGLSGDDRQNWIEMLKILLQKLLNHANDSNAKTLFEIFEVHILLDVFINMLMLSISVEINFSYILNCRISF